MNHVGYFEIQAENSEKAIKFYSSVFSWKFTKDPSIPIDYWRIEGAGPFGGLLKRPASISPPMSGTNAYVCSMQVESFDKTAKKILARRTNST